MLTGTVPFDNAMVSFGSLEPPSGGAQLQWGAAGRALTRGVRATDSRAELWQKQSLLC